MTPTTQPISDQTWARIRAEFTLPTLEQVHRRLSELMEDPEPVMEQLVGVFIDDEQWSMISAPKRKKTPTRHQPRPLSGKTLFSSLPGNRKY